MKNRKSVKFLAMLLIVMVMAPMFTVTAMAENPSPAVNVSFDKYLVVDTGVKVPAAEFSFTVKAGTPVAASLDNNTPAVLAGKVTGITPATLKATFTAGQDTFTSVQTNDIVTINGTVQAAGTSLTALKKEYAVQTVSFTIPAGTFTEPGVYRYVISEGTPAAPGFTADVDRYLDVYVTTDGADFTCVPVLHRTTAVATNAEGQNYNTIAANSKDTGFTNAYDSANLTVGKVVNGNQASRSNAFRVDVAVTLPTGVTDGTSYTVTASSALTAPAGAVSGANPATLTAADGKASGTFYLKHGQTVLISGLPKTTTYTVTEAFADANRDGYTVKAGDVTTAAADTAGMITAAATAITAGGASPVASTGKTLAESHYVYILNYRAGAVPTGIILDIAPYFLMVVIAGAALIALTSKKKCKSED